MKEISDTNQLDLEMVKFIQRDSCRKLTSTINNIEKAKAIILG
jgi:hypothetical protein